MLSHIWMVLVATAVSDFYRDENVRVLIFGRLALDLHHRGSDHNRCRCHVQVHRCRLARRCRFSYSRRESTSPKTFDEGYRGGTYGYPQPEVREKNLLGLENLLCNIHVYGRREHRLCDIILHTDHHSGDGFHGCHESSEKHPDFRGGYGLCAHRGLVDGQIEASLLFHCCGSCRWLDWICYSVVSK